VEELSRLDLVRLVERIMRADGGSQAEADALIERFAAAVPHPRATDLIFYPESIAGRELSPEGIVDLALGYRPVEQ